MVDHTFTLTNALNYMLKRVFSAFTYILYVATYNTIVFPGRVVNRISHLKCMSKGIYVGEVGMSSIERFIYLFRLLLCSLTYKPIPNPNTNPTTIKYNATILLVFVS